MKRVLFVVAALSGGGLEKVLLEILEAMDRSTEEYETDILTFYERDISQEDKFRVHVRDIYMVPRVTHGVVKFLVNCRRLIKKNRYDYVQAMVDFNGVLVCMAAMGTGVKKVICQSHNNAYPKIRSSVVMKMIQMLFQCLPCALMADSQEAAVGLFGRGPKKVVLAKNGIDTQAFAFDAAVRERVRTEQNADGKLIVGNIGRLCEQKNWPKQLEIFEGMLELAPNAEYWLIGDGEEREKVEQMIHDRGLQDKVRMFYYRSDIHELLQGMDMFLFPSLHEGQGIALVNAQCAGLFCAASTKVPAESDVTGNVLFLDLELPGDEWVRRIMDAYAGYERKDQSAKVRAAGYDRETAYDIYLEQMR